MRWLVEAKDQDKRRALDVAKSNIHEAIHKRLLFMGRYEIDLPHIHKSDTCIVVKASDVTTEKLYEEKFDEYKKSSKSDRLTKEDFKDVLKDLGTGLDDDVTFDSTFTKWDLDGDSRISKTEFVRFYKDHFSNGRDRDVVIKFMRNENQFNNETETRNNMKTRKKMGNSSDFIIQILKSYIAQRIKSFERLYLLMLGMFL